MARRRTYNSTAKVFGIALMALFAVIAIIISYAAFKGGTELRSQAATRRESVIKSWEFNTETEGWTAPDAYVRNGLFTVNVQSNAPLVLTNKNVNAKVAPGVKFSLRFGVYPMRAMRVLPASPEGESVLGTQTAKNRGGDVCAQVITYAWSEAGACRAFATPCDVPAGWREVPSCNTPSITPGIDPRKVRETPSACKKALTPARDTQTGQCMIFDTSCIDAGYVMDSSCRLPWKFSVDVSYRLQGKTSFEKPQSSALELKKENGEQFNILFPLSIPQPSVIEEIKIEFPQLSTWINARVEVDSITLTGPALLVAPTQRTLPTPTITKKPVPTSRVIPLPTVIVRPPTPTPTLKPKAKPPVWCALMGGVPGGTKSEEYKRYCML